jgi:hypothetical protein
VQQRCSNSAASWANRLWTFAHGIDFHLLAQALAGELADAYAVAEGVGIVTVLGDTLIAALRRLAQEHASWAASEGAAKGRPDAQLRLSKSTAVPWRSLGAARARPSGSSDRPPRGLQSEFSSITSIL